MGVKEIFKEFKAEESGNIFTLMPSEFKQHYKEYIKKPIESIETKTLKIKCESYLDFKSGSDHLESIWKSIQKAKIVIVNITGFKPSVMLELGVALVKKEKIILISEKTTDEKIDLPFNISTLGVHLYEIDKLNELSKWLRSEIKSLFPPDIEPILKTEEGRKNMKSAILHIKNKDFETAFLYLKETNRIEPDNWYVYKEWGKTFELQERFDEAIDKLMQALDYATEFNWKSEVYTQLGVVYRKMKKADRSMESFQLAENLYSNNANLYDEWAFYFNTEKKYKEAMDTMMKAIDLDSNNREYRWKFGYYSRKFEDTDNKFKISLAQYLKKKKLEEDIGVLESGNYRITSSTQNNPRQSNIFKNFTTKYSAKNRDIVEGTISNVVSHLGIFVKFIEGVSGLIHRRHLPPNFDIGNRFQVGQQLKAKVVYYDYEQKRIKLELADSHK